MEALGCGDLQHWLLARTQHQQLAHSSAADDRAGNKQQYDAGKASLLVRHGFKLSVACL